MRRLRALRARRDPERRLDSAPPLPRSSRAAANNQLATPEDGERLRAAGILYAPDYVINGGGAMHGIGLEQLGWDADELERKVAGIGDTLARLYEQAEAEGITRRRAERSPPSGCAAERRDRR